MAVGEVRHFKRCLESDLGSMEPGWNEWGRERLLSIPHDPVVLLEREGELPPGFGKRKDATKGPGEDARIPAGAVSQEQREPACVLQGAGEEHNARAEGKNKLPEPGAVSERPGSEGSSGAPQEENKREAPPGDNGTLSDLHDGTDQSAEHVVAPGSAGPRSLPQNRGDARMDLHELQSGTGTRKGLAEDSSSDGNVPGRKDDGADGRGTVKPRFSLLPPGTLAAIVDVLTFGAQVYGDDNWQRVPNARQRYYDALMRHVQAWWSGEVCDEKSGKHHMAHAAVNCLFLLWMSTENKER